MPHTKNRHPKQEEAEQIVRDLLARYLIVNMHDAAGGDPTEGMRATDRGAGLAPLGLWAKPTLDIVPLGTAAQEARIEPAIA